MDGFLVFELEKPVYLQWCVVVFGALGVSRNSYFVCLSKCSAFRRIIQYVCLGWLCHVPLFCL